MNIKALWGLVQAISGTGGINGFRDVIEQAEDDVMQMGDLIPAGEHAVERLDTAPPGGGVNVMVRQTPLRQKAQLLPIMLQVVNSVRRLLGSSLRAVAIFSDLW